MSPLLSGLTPLGDVTWMSPELTDVKSAAGITAVKSVSLLTETPVSWFPIQVTLVAPEKPVPEMSILVDGEPWFALDGVIAVTVIGESTVSRSFGDVRLDDNPSITIVSAV
jgi:hypothetical protein